VATQLTKNNFQRSIDDMEKLQVIINKTTISLITLTSYLESIGIGAKIIKLRSANLSSSSRESYKNYT
jgi:hypothetical protein